MAGDGIGEGEGERVKEPGDCGPSGRRGSGGGEWSGRTMGGRGDGGGPWAGR